jgi:hypothetical protein
MMLNFAERTGCGAIIVVWSFLMTYTRLLVYTLGISGRPSLFVGFPCGFRRSISTFTRTNDNAARRPEQSEGATDNQNQYRQGVKQSMSTCNQKQA